MSACGIFHEMRVEFQVWPKNQDSRRAEKLFKEGSLFFQRFETGLLQLNGVSALKSLHAKRDFAPDFKRGPAQSLCQKSAQPSKSTTGKSSFEGVCLLSGVISSVVSTFSPHFLHLLLSPPLRSGVWRGNSGRELWFAYSSIATNHL